MPDRKTFQATVRGHVQGVGFRWSVLARARQSGITGGVRNLSNGSVEVIAQGPETDLKELALELEGGMNVGNVSGVDLAWLEGAPVYTGFDIWPTR